MLPNAYFGSPEAGTLNWRDEDFEDAQVDDAELSETPEETVSLLGFDPLELENA